MKRIAAPIFEIVSNPSINMSDLINRRFGETSVENIIFDMIKKNGRDNTEANRSYIAKYVKERHTHENLKEAINRACPEYKEILEKFLALK